MILVLSPTPSDEHGFFLTSRSMINCLKSGYFYSSYLKFHILDILSEYFRAKAGAVNWGTVKLKQGFAV